MLLKLVKYILLIFVVFIVSFFISLKFDGEKKISPFFHNDSVARSIVYKFSLKGGKLEISAAKASVGGNLAYFLLDDMEATYTVKQNVTRIEARQCRVFPNKKTVYFGPQVVVKSKDLFFTTDSAVLDWGKRILYGNAKLSGYNGKLKFSADGFSIKEKEKIVLKRAKIRKEK